MVGNFENPDQIYLIVLLVCVVFLVVLLIASLFKSRKKNKKEVTPKSAITPTAPILAEPKIESLSSSIVDINTDVTANDEISKVLLAMEQDLNKPKVDPVLSFEEEQEEQAIISYRELLKTKQEQTKTEEPEDTFTWSNEVPVEIIDFPEEEVNISVKREPKEDMEEPGRFTNTEFISPIFGRMTENGYTMYEKPKEQPKKEEQPVIKKIDNKHNDQFLKELKEFRKNL